MSSSDGAARQLHRRHVAQELLDAGTGHGGVVTPPGQLVGVVEQGHHRTGDEVDGRLVPGHQQQDARGEQLALGQAGPVLVHGGHQPAEQVVTGVGPPLFQQIEEVAGESGHALAAGGDVLVGQQEVGVEALGHGRRPHPELLVVLGRHPQEHADELHGDGVGEPLHQVDLAVPDGQVEQFVDHLAGAPAEGLDHLGCERLGHQAPQPGVVGRVPEEEGPQLPGGHHHGVVGVEIATEGGRHALDVDVLPVRAGPAVPQHGQAVGVPGQHPEAERAPADGRLAAQVGVDRVGIPRPLRVEGVEDGSGGRAAAGRLRVAHAVERTGCHPGRPDGGRPGAGRAGAARAQSRTSGL